MNYHIEIEKLRLHLLHNPRLSLQQRQEGYQRLMTMTEDYLRAAGVAL